MPCRLPLRPFPAEDFSSDIVQVLLSLSAELNAVQRRDLALAFAQDMSDREGCAVDVAIHAPNPEGDERNHHAHILRTTRQLQADGLGDKLDTEKAGRKRKEDLEIVRARWAELTNQALVQAGEKARVDHRSLETQGIDRIPTAHLGAAAIGFERRTGQSSRLRWEFEQDIQNRLQLAHQLAESHRQTDNAILDLTTKLHAALAERQAQAQRVQKAMEPPALTSLGWQRWQAIATNTHDLQRAGLPGEQSLSDAAWHFRMNLQTDYKEPDEADGAQISADLQNLEGTMMMNAWENNTSVAQSFAEIMGLSPLRAGPLPKVSDLVHVAQRAAQSNFDNGKLALKQAQSNFNSFRDLVRERASQQTQLAQAVGGWQGDEHWEEWQRRVAKLKHYDPDDRFGPIRSARIYCELVHDALQEKSAYAMDWHALEIQAMRQGLELDPPWQVAQGIAEHSPMRIMPESRVELSALVAAQERAMNPEPDHRDRDAEDDYGNEPGF